MFRRRTTDNNVGGGEWGKRGRYDRGRSVNRSVDVDALGLGATMIWVILGAISAPHHGRPIFWANGESTGPFFEYVDLYVGLVQFRIKKNLTMQHRG